MKKNKKNKNIRTEICFQKMHATIPVTMFYDQKKSPQQRIY